MEISKEILEVIEKQIPAIAAGSLKEFIQKAQQNESALNDVNKRLKQSQEIIENYKTQEHKFMELNTREAILLAKEKELFVKEQSLQTTLLTKELEYIKQSKLDIYSLASIVFKNKEVFRMISGVETITGSGASGYTSQTRNISQTETDHDKE